MQERQTPRASASQFDIAEAQLSLEVLKQQGYIGLVISDDKPFARLFFSSLLAWRETKAKQRIAQDRLKAAEEEAHRQAILDWLGRAVPKLIGTHKFEVRVALDQSLSEAAMVLKRTFRDYLETNNPEAAQSMKVYVSAKRRTVLITL
jgi:hypothetical protein